MSNPLARIARALGEEPITHRPYTLDERRELVRAAEIVIEKNFGTETHESVAMWFTARLTELEITDPEQAKADRWNAIQAEVIEIDRLRAKHIKVGDWEAVKALDSDRAAKVRAQVAVFMGKTDDGS